VKRCSWVAGVLGQSHLAIAPDAEPAAVSGARQALGAIAARERAWLVVWKEFDPNRRARLAPLLERATAERNRGDARARPALQGLRDYCARHVRLPL